MARKCLTAEEKRLRRNAYQRKWSKTPKGRAYGEKLKKDPKRKAAVREMIKRYGNSPAGKAANRKFTQKP